jgi:hypothetical protein
MNGIHPITATEMILYVSSVKKSTSAYHTCLMSALIYFLAIYVCVSKVVYSYFPTIILYAFLMFSMHATCPAILIITAIIF